MTTRNKDMIRRAPGMELKDENHEWEIDSGNAAGMLIVSLMILFKNTERTSDIHLDEPRRDDG